MNTSANTQADPRRGLGLILLAALLWGTVGSATQAIYNVADTSALSIGLLRLALATPVLLAACWGAGLRTFRASRRDLSTQLTRATFDTLLRGTRLVQVEGDRYEIAVVEARHVAWLEHRLKRVVVKALTARVGQDVAVRFVG